MDTRKVFMVLSVWHAKKMNKIDLFIFLSRCRTKKMDNGQVSIFPRQKEPPRNETAKNLT